MPHPYLNVNPKAVGTLYLSPDAITARPELAACIAYAIANWSYVEISIGNLLGFMMGVKSEVGIAMYLSLVGSASQDAILEAVAQNYFSLDELDVFHAVKKCSDSPQKQRNNLAHGLWGINETMLDSLIWYPPKEVIKNVGEIHGIISQQIIAKSRGEDGRETPSPGISLEHAMVYRKKDFELLEKEMKLARGYWERLFSYRYGRAVFPENLEKYVQEFEKLCNEPPIREAVERLRKNRQNDQAKSGQ